MLWSAMIGHGTGESGEVTYRRAVEMGELLFKAWLNEQERKHAYDKVADDALAKARIK